MHQALRVSLAVLTAASAPTAVASGAAPSSDPVAPEVLRVLRDCHDHRDTITIRLDPVQLLAVYREFRRGRALRTTCGLAVSSRYTGRHLRPSDAQPKAVIDDCVRGAGALSGRYTVPALRRAHAALDHQQRTETSCPVGISSQYNANRPARSKALLPPRPPRPPRTPSPAPARTAESTERALSRYLAVFARPRTDKDVVPSWAAGMLSIDTKPEDATRARALGTRGDLVVVPTADGYAVVLRPAPGVVASTFTTLNRTGVPRLPLAVTRAVGGLKVWAPALIGMHRVRLLDGDGRWRSVSLAGDAIELTLRKVPMIVTYLDRDGVRHYADFNAATGGQVPAPRS
jgi:hypothetical protein